VVVLVIEVAGAAGKEHGPFWNDEMVDWWVDKFLTPDLLVRRKGERDSKPIHAFRPPCAFALQPQGRPMPPPVMAAAVALAAGGASVGGITGAVSPEAAAVAVTAEDILAQRRQERYQGVVAGVAGGSMPPPLPYLPPRPVHPAWQQPGSSYPGPMMMGPNGPMMMGPGGPMGYPHPGPGGPMGYPHPGPMAYPHPGPGGPMGYPHPGPGGPMGYPYPPRPYAPSGGYPPAPMVPPAAAAAAPAEGEAGSVHPERQALVGPPTSWFYMDAAGAEQGPFSSEQMRAMMAEQKISFQTKVRKSSEAGYSSLGGKIHEMAAPAPPPPPPSHVNRNHHAHTPQSRMNQMLSQIDQAQEHGANGGASGDVGGAMYGVPAYHGYAYANAPVAAGLPPPPPPQVPQYASFAAVSMRGPAGTLARCVQF
jgi:hypothetical protein